MCEFGFYFTKTKTKKIIFLENLDKTLPGGLKACTKHKDCHQWGECVFEQNSRLGVCKCRGHYVGDGFQHCGPPGFLKFKSLFFLNFINFRRKLSFTFCNYHSVTM